MYKHLLVLFALINISSCTVENNDALLFMYKKKSEFGANFYNGIYYDFTLESDRLIGTAMAIDLNLLAAPPEDQHQPPIAIHDIEELELINRWLPRLEIK